MLKIVASSTFSKQFSKLSPNNQQRIFKRVEKLAEQSQNLDVKKMQPKHLDFYCLRVGKWRIIFKYLNNNSTINLLKVDSRDSIYR